MEKVDETTMAAKEGTLLLPIPQAKDSIVTPSVVGIHRGQDWCDACDTLVALLLYYRKNVGRER